MNADFVASRSGNFKRMQSFGQSPWLDNISRCMIDSGDLSKLVSSGAITGITSNPSIFEKAINSGKCGYPETIKKLALSKLSVFEIYDTITREDIKSAANILKPVYEKSSGKDGYVSIEVAPDIAFDAQTSIKEAIRIHSLINEKNVLIKIPATKEGLEAIPVLLSKGININVTLMFSLNHYAAVADAYIKGLKGAIAAGTDISQINSVASVFVSRMDTLIDKRLNELAGDAGNVAEKEKILGLLGKAGVSNLKLIFKKFNEIFEGSEFSDIKSKGGNIQRLLFASTSTKNPAYYDLKYVEPFIGRNTVNTLPDETIEHIADHGNIAENSAAAQMAESSAVVSALAGLGIDLNEAGETLQAEGVKSFEDAYAKLLGSIKSISDNL